MEPTQITAGTTLKWTASYSDYPASAGWELSYILSNGAGVSIDITWATHITADGDDFSILLPATATAGFTATARGRLYGQVEKAGEIYPVHDSAIDIRVAGQLSYAVQMLNAIEAMLLGNASREEQSYAITTAAGLTKQLVLCSKSELLKLRAQFKNEVESERLADNIAKGLGTGRIIRNRYQEP